MNLVQIGILLAAAAQGQSPSGSAALEFEVASVKLSGPRSTRGVAGGPGSSDPTRYSFNSATLLDLITSAYHVDYFQISSKIPLDQDRFDLVAKLPPSMTRPQLRVMLQKLLVDRFHLRQHVESREFAAYELTVAKTGLKLTAPNGATDGRFPELPPDRPGMVSSHTVSGSFMVTRLSARQQTISALADMLPWPDTGPIVDQTGLTGTYNFTLEFARDLPNAPPESQIGTSPAPDLVTALKQQLGLQLLRKKIPFDVVVVETVDKRPTGN
jgi:uncharacterized protein (TIGR03435 family)